MTEEANASKLGGAVPSSLIRCQLPEMAWVVIVLAIAVRTFFFHPMSVPSASMEPTFRGSAVVNTRGQESNQARTGIRNWIGFVWGGTRTIHCLAKSTGRFEIVDARPIPVFGLGKVQRFRIGTVMHQVWFPPANLWAQAGLAGGEYFAEGDDVIRLRVRSGDRILVNRFIYNFRRPERGESVVLESRFVSMGPPGDYYLKRLVGLGGEAIAISDDRRLLVNGRAVPFSQFGFQGESAISISKGPEVGEFSGYLNGEQARQYRKSELAPLFPFASSSYRVPDGSVLVLGDNTLGSLDGRTWGGIPQAAIVGRPGFVFWPFADRFGVAPR